LIDGNKLYVIAGKENIPYAVCTDIE
jgi:hypothetical protein